LSKVIVITGAGVGLGRALARRFAADGESVVLLGRTLAKVEAAAAEIGERAMAVACDVGSPDSVRTAFAAVAARHARIDVLINNAAVFQPFLIAEASDAQLLEAIATNLTGPMLCARAAIPLLNRGGHIINVSSESVGMSGIRVTSVRAGQMFEEGKVWNVDPAAAMAFGKATMAIGLNLRERPISQFASVTNVFRALLDLPPDIAMPTVRLQARKQG